MERWAGTPHPSLFLEPVQRQFYQSMADATSKTGCLRFSRLSLNGKPIAFHFGFLYAGEFLWYKPTFDIELARYSPGEVLVLHLLRASEAKHASVFHFGIVDEAFEHRFFKLFSSGPWLGTAWPRELKCGLACRRR